MTDRAERRRNQRELEKAIQAQDVSKVIEIASRDQDETRPLAYTAGYIHIPCGGEAERANNFGAGAYCRSCGRTVPIEETRRAR